MVRAANTGISGIVDPYGRVAERSAIFQEAGIVGEVRLLSLRTVYSRIGDAVAFASIGIMVIAALVSRSTRQRGGEK